MPTFSFDLPYRIPLDDDRYQVNARGTIIAVDHTTVQQQGLDQRLGGIAGSFGFEQDQLGLVGYSRLTFITTAAEIEQLERAFFGELLRARGQPDHRAKGLLALAICNHFLDKYRAAIGESQVRTLGAGDLALLRYTDESTTAEIRLYGGGITLPVAGLAPDRRAHLVHQLGQREEPLTFELAALDATRAVTSGLTRESVIMAIGALETGLDLYFSRSWRVGVPRHGLKDAADELGVNPKNPATVDDVLKAAGIWQKVRAYAKRHSTLPDVHEALEEAIEVRNLVVHGGVPITIQIAERRVDAITRFIRDDLVKRIERECPPLPRAELLYAYEEALGVAPPPELEHLANAYLSPIGLDAKLHSPKPKSKGTTPEKAMTSDQYGRTLVLRVPFKTGGFTGRQIDLFIARALVHHWLVYRGDMPVARVAPMLPNEEARPGWSDVAREMTRAVWDFAIDRQLDGRGFGDAISEDIRTRAGALRQYYGPSYSSPASMEIREIIEPIRLARIAAALPSTDRAALLSAAAVAGEVAKRAGWILPTLEKANLDAQVSIRDALIRVHDSHPFVMASVTVFDPVDGSVHGSGVARGSSRAG